jgi:four helix bundle protein
MIKDVTDLEVYNLALSLLDPLYSVTTKIPQVHRKMKYQANEAAEKIPPQIAEGFGKKKSPREFCRFLAMAIGSSDEVITHLREITIVAKRFSGIDTAECDRLIEEYKVLSKRLNRLQSVWQKYD